MLSDYQLKLTDDNNISIDNNNKLVPNFFNNGKFSLYYKNLHLYLTVRLEIKIIYLVSEFHQSKWLKPYIEFNRQKRREAEKNDEKHGEAF